MRYAPGFALILAALTGCSSSSDAPVKPTPVHTTATNANNPVAKFIEVVGFRIVEKSAGKINITFGVVNHSDADIGGLELLVNLRTTAGKPDDPPLFTFPAKVGDIGPNQMKDVTVETQTKLRVYELPDWQFIKADFSVTAPQ